MTDHAAQALEDMLSNAEKALEYFKRNPERWQSDEMRVDAILRRVGVVCEAASRVPVPARAQYPEIRWRELIGMRQRIVHGYDQLDFNVLGEVLRQHLPELIAQLRARGIGA